MIAVVMSVPSTKHKAQSQAYYLRSRGKSRERTKLKRRQGKYDNLCLILQQLRFGILFAKAELEDQGQNSRTFLKEGSEMKRLLVLILVWTLLVVTGTLVSANGQVRVKESNDTISIQFAMKNNPDKLFRTYGGK